MTYEIAEDSNEKITFWVCHGLDIGAAWLGRHLTFGFLLDGRLVGGLIFHDYRPEQDVWWTVYTTDKRWCNRRMLRQMFGLAFCGLKCRRINLLVSKSNTECLKFVEKLGFTKEGLLREYRENGEDCYFLGMLRQECKWIKTKGENK